MLNVIEEYQTTLPSFLAALISAEYTEELNATTKKHNAKTVPNNFFRYIE